MLSKAAVALSLFVTAATYASPSQTPDAQARRCFEAGSSLYDKGNFQQAIDAFEQGYGFTKKARFLRNIGLSYWRLGDLDHALEYHERFLREADVADPDRARAGEDVARLRRAIGDRDAAANVEAHSNKPPPSPPAVASPPLQPAPPAAKPVVETSAPPVIRSRSKKALIWGTTVGAVLLAGAGLTVGLLLGLPSHPSSQLGTVSF